MSDERYRRATEDEIAAWFDNDQTSPTGIRSDVVVPVEPDQEIHAPDGTLLGVVIYNDAGREFNDGVHYEDLPWYEVERDQIGDSDE